MFNLNFVTEYVSVSVEKFAVSILNINLIIIQMRLQIQFYQTWNINLATASVVCPRMAANNKLLTSFVLHVYNKSNNQQILLHNCPSFKLLDIA